MRPSDEIFEIAEKQYEIIHRTSRQEAQAIPKDIMIYAMLEYLNKHYLPPINIELPTNNDVDWIPGALMKDDLPTE